MSATDIASGIAGGVGWITQILIFWKSWDPFAKQLLLITIVLLVLGYIYLKSEMSRRLPRG